MQRNTQFSDGTVAVDLDPLSLLCRLVALVPAPRFHTVRYFGVLAAAAKWVSGAPTPFLKVSAAEPIVAG
jgi:Putative transposase